MDGWLVAWCTLGWREHTLLTLWALTVATILADAAVIPPSLKWAKMWDVKPCSIQSSLFVKRWLLSTGSWHCCRAGICRPVVQQYVSSRWRKVGWPMFLLETLRRGQHNALHRPRTHCCCNHSLLLTSPLSQCRVCIGVLDLMGLIITSGTCCGQKAHSTNDTSGGRSGTQSCWWVVPQTCVDLV